jgi:hypothetical protein
MFPRFLATICVLLLGLTIAAAAQTPSGEIRAARRCRA